MMVDRAKLRRMRETVYSPSRQIGGLATTVYDLVDRCAVCPNQRRNMERKPSMTRELFWLTLTVILTGLLWVPYVLNRCQVRGLGGAMANPTRNDKPQAEWANRLMFAHDNAIENLVIFAPLVLILNAIDYSTKWTVLACAVYFWARVAHLIVYALGIPVFRTLAFTVGFLAQAVLALAIFKVF
jgi:uncharacterized MAPEG superfamily protein